jgi:ABC-2 type transport system ATP-binding protein
VLAGLDLAVPAGTVFALLGPNGAGKTTTLESVIGLRQPDEGYVEICGIDARRQPREVKQRIGAALQTTALQDKITPREALELFGSFYRQRADPQHLLTRFGLADCADAAFESLSGGLRQRLALALAFVNQPALVLLDEPTAGLDPPSRRELHGEIARMKRDGHTVLLTTHQMDEAEALCDRVAIIDKGRIVADGAPRDLIARSRSMQSVSLTTAHPLNREWLASLPGVQDLACEGVSACFRTANASRTLAELMTLLDTKNIELAELRVQKATLEDVFIELTQQAAEK